MEHLTYPLLCWRLSDDLVLGHVVGTGVSFVDSTVRRLKSSLVALLADELASQNRDVEPCIHDARLKLVRLPFRPSYKEDGRFFAAPRETEVQVPAVYGATDHESFECFLPSLETSFVYYDAAQLDTLLRHFGRDAIRRLTPEHVALLLLPGPPAIEEIQINAAAVKRRASVVEERRSVEHLQRAADLYPAPAGIRRKTSVLPEAAWEQGELIRTIADMIVPAGSNVLLVGESGVGKTAILRDAMLEIRRKQKLRDKNTPVTFWRTSPQRLVAGAKYLGEWQQICDNIVEELANSRGVLWLNDVATLVRTGGQAAEDSMAAYLLGDLRRGRLQIVGEVTPRELESMRRLLPGFVELFRTVHVEEMGRATLLKVLDNFRQYAAKNIEIDIEKEAIDIAHRLLDRFVRHEKFPGKAMVFLGRCLNEAIRDGRPVVTQRHVQDAFAEKSGLPAVFLRDDLRLDKHEMESWFGARIKGQDRALEAMTSIVTLFKAGLCDPGKPVATLIFAGPTGVGKTASARALAQYFFGHGQKLDPLIRIDMSEFQYPGQVSRLIGEPGASDPGRLAREIRERPFSVLLLDEIEKAHPLIFDVLLNVLDEGILMDAFGRTTSFRNAIIIMTSNLGSAAPASLGFESRGRPDYRSTVQSFFRPEFFNRIDDVVVFHPLDQQAVAEITRKELNDLTARDGFVRRGITLAFSEELVQRLAREGFHPKYGARPLQRTIERVVVGALSRHLLLNRELSNCRLEVGDAGGDITIVSR